MPAELCRDNLVRTTIFQFVSIVTLCNPTHDLLICHHYELLHMYLL